MTLYRRAIRVTTAGLRIALPRISFEVNREADATQTTGHVNVYNLSPETAQRIYQRGDDIRIEAGYPDTIATVFEGSVQRVRRHRQNLAHITHITLGDEIRKRRLLGGVTTRSYFGPVPLRQIITDIVTQDLKLTIGPLDAISPYIHVPNFSWTGGSAHCLTYTLGQYSLHWYEDDGVVRVRNGERQPDTTLVTVSPDTGLIGTPQETEEGVEVTMFLNPEVQRGGILALRSDALTGRYRVVALRHSADNWESSPFHTWTDCRAIETDPTPQFRVAGPRLGG